MDKSVIQSQSVKYYPYIKDWEGNPFDPGGTDVERNAFCFGAEFAQAQVIYRTIEIFYKLIEDGKIAVSKSSAGRIIKEYEQTILNDDKATIPVGRLELEYNRC